MAVGRARSVDLLLVLMARNLNLLYRVKSQEKILSSLTFRNSVSREETRQGEWYEQSDPASTAALWSVSCLTDE